LDRDADVPVWHPATQKRGEAREQGACPGITAYIAVNDEALALGRLLLSRGVAAGSVSGKGMAHGIPNDLSMPANGLARPQPLHGRIAAQAMPIGVLTTLARATDF
jgi:hypothetical protein